MGHRCRAGQFPRQHADHARPDGGVKTLPPSRAHPQHGADA
jgi:hypothetical protein